MKFTVTLLVAALTAVVAEDHLGQSNSYLNQQSPSQPQPTYGGQQNIDHGQYQQDYAQLQSFRAQQQQQLQQQQNADPSNAAGSAAVMGYGPAVSNAGMVAQADVVPTVPVATGYSVATPSLASSVPGFYFNSGFNKQLGLSLPKPFAKVAAASAVPVATYYPQYSYPVAHSPLGELLASKVDLLPAIFKTGLVAAFVFVLFKLIVMLFAFKATKVGALASAVNRIPKPVSPSGGSGNLVPAEIHAASTMYSDSNFMSAKEGGAKDANREKRELGEKVGRPAMSDKELDYITHRVASAFENLPKSL